MKNEIKYNRNECPKSKRHINFGENMTFKKLYQKLFSKMSPVDFRSLGYDHIQQSRPI